MRAIRMMAVGQIKNALPSDLGLACVPSIVNRPNPRGKPSPGQTSPNWLRRFQGTVDGEE